MFVCVVCMCGYECLHYACLCAVRASESGCVCEYVCVRVYACVSRACACVRSGYLGACVTHICIHTHKQTHTHNQTHTHTHARTPVVESPEHPQLVHGVDEDILGRGVHEVKVQEVVHSQGLEEENDVAWGREHEKRGENRRVDGRA